MAHIMRHYAQVRSRSRVLEKAVLRERIPSVTVRVLL